MPSSRKMMLPTPAELRLLEILWRIGEGTIDDVLQASGENPPPHYKTVQTLLRIMERKKLIHHHQRGRAFLFIPEVERDQINRLSVSSLLSRNFRGSPAELLVNLLEDERINEKELDELEELIRQRRKSRELS